MALSDPNTVGALQNVVSAYKVVNAYVKFVADLKDNITQLPDFEIIRQHLQAAKANAQHWQTVLYPMCEATGRDILIFSETFYKEIQVLQDFIPQLKNGTPGVKEKVESELKKLIEALDGQKGSISSVAAKVSKFGEDEAESLKNFHSDAEKAQVEIVGDNKELQSLQDQLNSIEKAITRDKVLIAGGILSIWIAVAAGIDLKKQEDAKNSVEAQITMKKQELVNISAFKEHYDQLNLAGGDVSQALTQLQKVWSSLGVDVKEVIGQLKTLSSSESADYFQPLLDAASKDWKNVVEVAKTLSD